MTSSQPDFFVVLGPDFAGKSSVLAELERTRAPYRVLSTDDAFTSREHSLITRLRRDVVKDVLPALNRGYSPDFLASLLQTAVVHLRDLVREAGPGDPLLVDSYYYKILAKCRLSGVTENPMFDWWRSFPQPRRVIYLDIPPETTWERCGRGASTNPLEHYGERPDLASFAAYQRDLRKLMWEETAHLPVTVIGQRDGVARTAQDVREAITHERD
ncbi:thymidylate kinase [Kitasatospora sp. MAP12-15]|uniref:hypothetical protein n=1 Tax=unclassified Kitasatospora TaxID=2633591 RepID=UPI002476D6F5|nr:hypothetical protein [Kitasatospora sp. MAP12-44]MDH6113615.1 thymidylate kinase [Kitasatospora sp. MAP12-44]